MKIIRKELNKHIKAAVKEIKQKYGYKTRDAKLYKKSGDYFIDILLVATGVNHNKIYVRGAVRPYFFDDVFWEVFQMPENRKEPMGLRANGAFAVRGLQVYEEYKEVESYDEAAGYVEELLQACDAEIAAVINATGSDFSRFISYSQSMKVGNLYDYELARMLVAIQEEHYQEARELALHEIANHRHGNFQNHGKWIYEHVIDFCMDKCDRSECHASMDAPI